MQGKCSLRGKIERASRPNQLLRLGTNVPSAPHSATCRLLVQLGEFPLICLTLRALGTELGPGFPVHLILSCLPPSWVLHCTPGAVLVPVAAALGFVWDCSEQRAGIYLSPSVVQNSKEDVEVMCVLPNADLAESSCSPRFTKENLLKLMMKPPHLSYSDMGLEDNLSPLNSSGLQHLTSLELLNKDDKQPSSWG